MNSEQYGKDLETLVKFSTMINSSLDIFEVLNNSMRFVEELIDAEACSIFELDYDTNELFFRVLSGERTNKAKDIRLKIGEGVAGWVADTGEALIVKDTDNDSRFSPKVDIATGFKTRSIIALPIFTQERLVGVLEALNKCTQESFSEGDLELLKIVANQIGIAMENAKLYEKLKVRFAVTQKELAHTQEKLLRTERLAALGHLSQGIAHEVRNPVMSIGGFARRLLKKLPKDDPMREYVEIILKETGRLEKMVRDVENFTSKPAPVIKRLKLSEFLRYTLRNWKKTPFGNVLKIELETMKEDPVIYIDKNQMAEALMHLLVNSTEAMNSRGTLTLSTKWDGKYLNISVKDTGPGIKPEDLPRLFDPFFTSKPQGSGLGLTTVNRIVTEHGGEVRVFSEPGKGAEVTLRIPRFYEEEL